MDRFATFLHIVPHLIRLPQDSASARRGQLRCPSASMDDLDQRKDTLQSWRQLEEEIRDLYDLIAEFANIVVGSGVRKERKEGKEEQK